MKLKCSVCWYDSPGDGVGVSVGNTLEDVGVGFVVVDADYENIQKWLVVPYLHFEAE